ncbi:MAG: EAL domain-containing protein [Desulfobacteraceae bacterium]|nr:EAL domain-containing protein [Desulfobacteraceae bacterium]
MSQKEDNSTKSAQEQGRLKVRHIEQEPALAFFRFDQTPLREVIEDLPDGYYEVNLRGDLIAFNRALCRIHGYDPETMVNMNYQEFTPAELHEAVFQTYVEVYNTGRPLQILDFQVTRPDGSICIIHTSVHLVRDKDGNATGFRGISRDVTEQKRNEAYERARTRVLEGIARNAPLKENLEDILASLKAQMPDIKGMFLQAESDHLEFMAGPDITETFAASLNNERIDPHGNIWSRAAFQKEPIIIDCVAENKHCRMHRDKLLARDIEAIWAYPVLGREGSLLGVLVGFPGTAREPLAREKEWLHSATATAEIAFSHHRITSELAYLSHHDTLTGILNRRSFMTESERLLALSRRQRWTAGMLFLDLDQFKAVNDTWGHQIGDLLLTSATARLNECLRQSDCLARLGGDEFAILVPEAGTDACRIIANRILETMAEPFELNEILVNVGISIGVSLAPPDQKITADQLLTEADEAMYQAKTHGQGWAFYKDKQHREARKKAEMEMQLRQAMTTNELVVHYQPVRELHSGKWVGAEALIRWHHPERGMLRAAEFLHVAESRGLIREIDRYVLPRVLQETRNWKGWIAVNVSPLTLSQPDWPGFVGDLLKTYDFPPERLILEVTERILLDMERVNGVLKELSQLGVYLALDDFGTGYSSLSYLTRLSVHSLKMDREFIRELGDGTRNTALVQTILAMAEKLGLAVVAEGVENAQDLKWLTENGCGLAQGFFLARPAAWPDLDL